MWAAELPSINAILTYFLQVADKAPGADEIRFGHSRPVAAFIAELIHGFPVDLSQVAVPDNLFFMPSFSS